MSSAAPLSKIIVASVIGAFIIIAGTPGISAWREQRRRAAASG